MTAEPPFRVLAGFDMDSTGQIEADEFLSIYRFLHANKVMRHPELKLNIPP